MCPRNTVGGKMSDKDLEQRINIKFCVMICKSDSETLVLLTLSCIINEVLVHEVIRKSEAYRCYS
jgi:hypothetical protein